MKIFKNVDGTIVELIVDKLEECFRGNVKYNICQVSKLVDGVKVPLYRECFSDSEIHKMESNGYKIKGYNNLFDAAKI